jgi:Endonuclease/Exonuclease/phosphatase family
MLTFLFWNLKSQRSDLLAGLAKQHAVDVVMLAECPIKPATILEALNRERSDYFYVPTQCPKVSIYTRFSDEYLLAHMDGDDFSIRRLRLLNRPEILICTVHFPSKLRQDAIDQTMYTVNFSNELVKAEETAGHTRTVLVGDLNMNPYEDGMVTSKGLHAVMTREIASRPTRRVKFESNTYFYNPMWRHFGEREQGHAGTYYFANPKARADFWNIYDQVLLRPDLLPYFDPEDLMILHYDRVTNESFLTADGFPDTRRISDHLPILFRLRI